MLRTNPHFAQQVKPKVTPSGVTKLVSDTFAEIGVNRQKSCVCRTAGVEFLGFELHGYGGQIRVSEKNVKKFKERSREILNRNRGISMAR